MPESTPLVPGGKGGGQQQEDAEKALERAFGGADEPASKDQPNAPAPDATKAPSNESAPPANELAPSSDQEDAMKALERAMQGTPAPPPAK